MKTFFMAITVIIAITLVQQVSGQQISDSVFIADNQRIQGRITDLQMQLSKDSTAAFTKDKEMWILELGLGCVNLGYSLIKLYENNAMTIQELRDSLPKKIPGANQETQESLFKELDNWIQMDPTIISKNKEPLDLDSKDFNEYQTLLLKNPSFSLKREGDIMLLGLCLGLIEQNKIVFELYQRQNELIRKLEKIIEAIAEESDKSK
ncbi:MAG: hypothetical protein WC875_01625 [Candidatus Absconditabacterales bacterium]|jgi:hypothetical protein